MSRLRNRIRNIIDDERLKSPSCAFGIVNRTYPEEYACDVIIVNNNTPGSVDIARKVPLPMIGGLSYVMPHAGDKVLVEFLGGDPSFPLITSIYPTVTSQIEDHSTVPTSSISHFEMFI